MNSENGAPHFFFALGMEQKPFLDRVEVVRRRRVGKAVYRDAYFEKRHLVVVRSGIGPTRAAAAARCAQGRPEAFVVVGTAGALVGGLPAGHVVISTATMPAKEPDRRLYSSTGLVKALSQACSVMGISYRCEPIATSERAVFDKRERLLLHGATGAHAVDMESHAVAVEAQALGLPFVAVRVISDDIDSPPLPDRGMLKDALKHPTKWPTWLRGTVRWAVFLRSFRRSLQVLPPVLVRCLRTWDRNALGAVPGSPSAAEDQR
ncbi:MAG: hypothetical protein V2B18_19100 [Pseudomonadota bacterium]